MSQVGWTGTRYTDIRVRAQCGLISWQVYKGAYQGLVRDDLGALQVFYIKWGASKQMEQPWGSTVWRAVLQG